MYSFNHSKQSADFLKKAERILAKRLTEKAESLVDDPVPHDAVSLGRLNGPVFRVRVGKYRIIYEVDFSKKIIGIIKIDKRDSVYD
jgi:mRNA interferase RelE/StbE